MLVAHLSLYSLLFDYSNNHRSHRNCYSEMTISSRLAFVRKVWQTFVENEGLEKSILRNMTITDASDGKIICELPNRLGSAHGGFLSTLVDIGGSVVLCTKGMHSTGVSTDLNVTFINPAKEGDIIVMDSECVKVGKTIAYTVVDIRNKKDGKLIAQGRHTKFIAIAHKDPKNVKL
ncbi:hypothetical protein RclHR1_00920031 [Rhizophagus clarus]|uniref:Acyl-coenzyme A thioesterase 13 n=1 Tax=Rhizophagus clarus TaxID=94130 RepID=A0A2Z6S9Q5_9GLOM|nr:hypothetical protein RclHR1_00920031 [Rhizophagus clarus]